ncbi:MAG: glutamyl-tRNA reductase [Cytophagales bacterium]|nr:glutamyl-tRNA reductase [Cytophagales bacterium]
MQSKLKFISLSHKNAPLEVREFFTFGEAQTKKLLADLIQNFDLQEALVISTCNRTEIYYNSEIDINDSLIEYLVNAYAHHLPHDAAKYFIKNTNPEEAVKYLIEVSLGLQSQVLGDLQVSHQIKKAYQWTADLNMAGAFLHRLMHSVFFANKRVAQETSFRDGAASISYAAAQIVDHIFANAKNVPILLIGAGEMGADTAHNLYDFGYENITISNRTLDRSMKLSAGIADGNIIGILPYENIHENIQNFEVIISAIDTDSPIIDKTNLNIKSMFVHKYFIDLSIPRSIHTNIEDISGIVLYNLDDLNKKTSEAQKIREKSIPQVQKIVMDTLEDFADWTKEMEYSPTIHKIKNALETIRQEEINRQMKHLNEYELKNIELITKNIMNKLMRLPAVQLKAACKRGNADSLAEVLNELFDIDKSSIVHEKH